MLHGADAASAAGLSKIDDVPTAGAGSNEPKTVEPMPQPVTLRSYSWYQSQRFVFLAVKVPGLPDREASCISCEFTADTFKLKVCLVEQQQQQPNSARLTSCGDKNSSNGITWEKKGVSCAKRTPDKSRVSHELFINNLARKVNTEGCSYRIKADEVRVKLAKLVPNEEWLAVTATEDKELRRKAYINHLFDKIDRVRSEKESVGNEAGKKVTTEVKYEKKVPKKLTGDCTNTNNSGCVTSTRLHSAAAASTKAVDVSTISSNGQKTVEPLPVTLRSYSWHQCQRFVRLAVKVPGLPNREAKCVSCEFTADTFKLKVCPAEQQQLNKSTQTSCALDYNPNDTLQKKNVSCIKGTPEKYRVSYVLFVNNLAKKVNTDGCSYRIKADEVRVKLAKLVPDEEWLAVTATEDKELRRKININHRADEKDEESNHETSTRDDVEEKVKTIANTNAANLTKEEAVVLSSTMNFFSKFFMEQNDEELKEFGCSSLPKTSSCCTVTRPCDVAAALQAIKHSSPKLVRVAIREDTSDYEEGLFTRIIVVLSRVTCCVKFRCLDSFLGTNETAYNMDMCRVGIMTHDSLCRLTEFWGCLLPELSALLPLELCRLGQSVRCKRDYDVLLDLHPLSKLTTIAKHHWRVKQSPEYIIICAANPHCQASEEAHNYDLLVQRSVSAASLRVLPARYTALTLHFRGLADHDMEWMMIVLTRVAGKNRTPSLCLHASQLTATGARVLARRLSHFRLTDIRIEAPLVSLADRGQVEKLFAEGAGCPCYWSIDLLWGEK